jgi:hypothetical protein
MSHNNFIVNKYYHWYYSIINYRIDNTPVGYCEKHHILPKCLGGSNDKLNLVQLTAREHFICHLLLVKITVGDDNKKMRRAVGMFKMATSKVHRKPTPKQYQLIRMITANLPNSMNSEKTKSKHLDSIAQKIGYTDYQTYVATIKSAFEQYKTVKCTAEKTGHSQYAIRHLLLNNFGKEWVDTIRQAGLAEGKHRSIESNRKRPKRNSSAEQNYNAYVWEAKSPTGEIIIVKGNRLDFCKKQGIGSSLDTQKPHLRGFWEFKKLCKVKDYIS